MESKIKNKEKMERKRKLKETYSGNKISREICKS